MLASYSTGLAQESRALNVAEWQAAQEILEDAKVKVESGWYQNEPPAGGPRTYCMSTAMQQALIDQNKTMVDFDYAKLALNNAIEAPPTLPTSADDPLSVPYWGRFFVYWNDAPGRTKEEVVQAFEEAIAYASDQRAAAVQANKTEADILEYDRLSIQRLGLAKQ
ncbi:hypothetical protein GOD60_14125 [Sinorhizobium medicae]|nr:hypothetical protein [Sinorhizobium medicae]